MALSSKFRFDWGERSADLEYWLADVKKDYWSLASGRITAPEFQEFTMGTQQAFRTIHTPAMEWVGFITARWTPPRFPKSNFTAFVRKRNQGIQSYWQLRGVKYIDVVWDKDTDELTVKLRPAINLKWADYLLYLKHWERIYAEIANFSKN